MYFSDFPHETYLLALILESDQYMLQLVRILALIFMIQVFKLEILFMLFKDQSLTFCESALLWIRLKFLIHLLLIIYR